MSDWLDPVRRALDDAPSPIDFFFRDDDAGWSDELLLYLLDVFARHETAIDLAVIPGALGDDLATRLAQRMTMADGRIGVHQHGFNHADYEPAGRKCEFGAARPKAALRRDLVDGKQRLEAAMGSVFDPIFTPPWNRCSQDTVDILAALGFRVLSRDDSAAPVRLDGLTELPVRVDWCKWLKQPADRPVLGRVIAESARRSPPVGIMLHHAVMPDDDRAAIDQLLALLGDHPNAHCRRMQSLAGGPGWHPRTAAAAG